MKITRKIPALISLVLIIAMLLSIASCSFGGDNDNDKNPNEDVCEHVDIGDDGLCDLCDEAYQDGCDNHIDADDDGFCDRDDCSKRYSDGCDNHKDSDDDGFCDTADCDETCDDGCDNHVDRDDNGICDITGCDTNFADGCDNHRDRNDDGICDVSGCKQPFDDNCDHHSDKDDDGKCDVPGCNTPYEDGCNNHRDADDDGVCDSEGCYVLVDDGVDIVYVNLILRERGSGDLITKRTFLKGHTLSAEEVESIYDTEYHGYKYATWYTSNNSVVDTTLTLTDDETVIYGERGNLAGENITWSYDLFTDTLTISGSGPMFDFEFNDDAPWIVYAPLVSEIIISEGITSIGSCAFYNFLSLDDVHLPSTIQRIGDAAFYGSSITSINFPEPLTEISDFAFFRCENLISLCFNDGLSFIGNGAFYECSGVEYVILTDKIAEIGNSAFYMNTNLQTAYYLGTKEQYDKMFVRLDNFWVQQLANTYYISNEKPSELGPYWYFDGDGGIQHWYYTVSYYSANGKVPFAFDYVDPAIGVTEDNVAFMNSIVYHGYKFQGWRHFTTNSDIDYSVGTRLNGDTRLRGVRQKVCGDNMLYRINDGILYLEGSGRMWDFEEPGDAPWTSSNIDRIVIGGGIEYIGSFAICNKYSITYIEIPLNIVEIHPDAFFGCNNLMYVYYEGNAEQMAEVKGIEMFNTLHSAVLYARYVEGSPAEGSYWSYITGLVTEGEKRVAWQLKDGVLSVGGDQSLVNYNSVTDTPWYAARDLITSVVIRDKANRVGANSFFGMTSVTSVTVPDSVLKIAESAFAGTGFYNDEANWDGGALYISKHLIKVLPEVGITHFVMRQDTISIAENAFAGCSTITSMEFSKNIRGIYRAALSGLSSLDTIFYLGVSASAWDTIWRESDYDSQELYGATVYILSNRQPTEEGNWWRYEYDELGTPIPTIW